MTREQILQARPGPALNALVHEHVFGKRIFTWEEMEEEARRVWEKQPNCRFFMMGFEALWADGAWEFWQDIPRYSERIEAAFEVIACLVEMENDDGDLYTVALCGNAVDWLCVVNEIRDNRVEARAPTAPEAICKCALLAGLEQREHQTS